MVVGTAVVTISARDPAGLEARQLASVTVRATNQAPEARGTIPQQTLEAGASPDLDVASYFRDPDDDPLDYTVGTSNAAVATAFGVGQRGYDFRNQPGLDDPYGHGNRPEQCGSPPRRSVSRLNKATGRPKGAARSLLRLWRPARRQRSMRRPYFRDPDGDQLSYATTSSNPRGRRGIQTGKPGDDHGGGPGNGDGHRDGE